MYLHFSCKESEVRNDFVMMILFIYFCPKSHFGLFSRKKTQILNFEGDT